MWHPNGLPLFHSSRCAGGVLMLSGVLLVSLSLACVCYTTVESSDGSHSGLPQPLLMLIVILRGRDTGKCCFAGSARRCFRGSDSCASDRRRLHCRLRSATSSGRVSLCGVSRPACPAGCSELRAGPDLRFWRPCDAMRCFCNENLSDQDALHNFRARKEAPPWVPLLLPCCC